MKYSIRSLENVFSIVSLLLFSQGFYPIILGSGSSEEADIDSPLLRLIFILIYFVTIGLLTFRWQRSLAFLRTNLWLLFLIGLAIASISWSSIPAISFRKVIALLGTTFFGIYLGSRYTFEQQLKIYGWVFGIAVFFSFLFALLIPEYGIMNTISITGAFIFSIFVNSYSRTHCFWAFITFDLRL
ncbi:MAG TPA: hypothetical protein V6C71_20020 [Coleofasciculaceae cyanobacterium]|jgi:hypothetical protein